VLFQGEKKQCYISHVNTRITASKKPLSLVLIYGLGETPMMLATNKRLKSKEDVVSILRTYMSRWRIEEYFRFKKQHFGFEGYRVRSLKSMIALNMLLSYAITFLAVVQKKKPSHKVKCKVFENAGALREKAIFFYYRIAKALPRSSPERKRESRGGSRLCA
jgi:transposase